MTRDEAVARIKEQLGFRTTLDSEVVTHLQLAQTMLEDAPTKPWFLIATEDTLSTVADTRTIAVPENFLQEVEEVGLYYVPSDTDEDEVRLDKDDYQNLKLVYKSEDSGPPRAYALLGDLFHIFPLPDDVYTIKTILYKRDTELTSDITNGWLTHVPYLLLGTALKQIAEGPIRDAVATRVADQWIAAGLKILANRTAARATAARVPQIGGRHY